MRRSTPVLLAAGLAAVAGTAVPAAAAASQPVSQLRGELVLAAGSCVGGHPSGSYLSATFGTRAIRNPRSNCAGGAVTLLAPGRAGISTKWFSPSSDAAFNGRGEPVAETIAQPARFGAHEFALVTSARNLQDAARGPALFALPKIYVAGSRAYADLRSLQALYGGLAGSTCASASGYGCWLIGTERATGTYQAATHRLTLSWFTGQSFVGSSAGTAVHLTGLFRGIAVPLHQGASVELGTSSFAAGGSQIEPVARHKSADRTTRSRVPRAAARATAAVQPDDASTTTGSPRTFLIAEVVVLVNIVAFIAGLRRRRRR
jgi:hypothetical protein